MQIMNNKTRLFFMSSLVVCSIMSMEQDEKDIQAARDKRPWERNQPQTTEEQVLEQLHNSLASLPDADAKKQRTKILLCIKERSGKIIKDKPNS